MDELVLKLSYGLIQFSESLLLLQLWTLLYFVICEHTFSTLN